jgi:hypothetical protein
MPDRTGDKTFMVRYILGQVSPEERAGFEERYQADEDLFEELVAAENDLIDAYARGELSGTDRLRFESRFLATPELRERVKFAKSLAGHISETAPAEAAPGWWKFITPGRPVTRFAFSAVVLGLLLWGVWMTTSNVRLRHELEHMAAERDKLGQQQKDFQSQLTELNAQLKRLQDSPSAQEIARLAETSRPMISLALSPGLVRTDQGPNILPISPGVSTALLLLKTRDGLYSSYSVSLETPEGRQVFKRDGLQSWPAGEMTMVSVSLPSTALQRGDYVLRLTGHAGGKSEEIDVYSFRVVAK